MVLVMESRLLLTQRAQRSLSLAALVFGLCSAFGLPGPGRRAARASSARLFGAMSPAPPVSWPSGAAVASSESVCSVVAASAGVRRVPRRVIKAQQRKGAVRGIRLFRLFRLSRSGLQCPPELAWVEGHDLSNEDTHDECKTVAFAAALGPSNFCGCPRHDSDSGTHTF